MAKINVTESRVLIEMHEENLVTPSGLEIVRLNDKPVPHRGTVIGVGPDAEEVEVGDVVLVEKYHGGVVDKRELGLDETLIIVHEEHILCVLPDINVALGDNTGGPAPVFDGNQYVRRE